MLLPPSSSSASDVVLLQELVLMSLYSLGTALIGRMLPDDDLGTWEEEDEVPTTLRITTW